MKRSLFYPVVTPDTGETRAIGHAGGAILTHTVAATRLDESMARHLGPWLRPWAVHHPGKVLVDLAITLALGGDALSDLGQVRGEPGVFGRVASDPVVSRLVAELGRTPGKAVRAISRARAEARAQAWRLAGDRAPTWGMSRDRPLIVDLDATLVTAHSDKQGAAPTFKKGYGHHPMTASVDHGQDGTGETLAVVLRPGNAGSNKAADHIEAVRQAFAQLPCRPNRKILVRTDGAGATHDFVDWLEDYQHVSYSIGFTLPDNMPEVYRLIPPDVWTPAYDSGGDPREGADTAEITKLIDLKTWPGNMRVIVRRERPHPGAQLRFDDVDGYRLTGFATNTQVGQLPDLELRHRLRARCEDRIRNAKDTGLRNLPLQGFGQNQVWCQLVALAMDLIAWAQMLALHDHSARRWEPKRLRFRLFSIPAVLVTTGRRRVLRFSDRSPHSGLAAMALARLRPLVLAPG
jgi:hypothetical protein